MLLPHTIHDKGVLYCFLHTVVQNLISFAVIAKGSVSGSNMAEARSSLNATVV